MRSQLCQLCTKSLLFGRVDSFQITFLSSTPIIHACYFCGLPYDTVVRYTLNCKCTTIKDTCTGCPSKSWTLDNHNFKKSNWESGFLYFKVVEILESNVVLVVVHSVWKSQKKSHSKLRAKRATFSFWVGKSSSKMPIMRQFGDFLKPWSWWSNSVTKIINFYRTKNLWKMPQF